MKADVQNTPRLESFMCGMASIWGHFLETTQEQKTPGSRLIEVINQLTLTETTVNRRVMDIVNNGIKRELKASA